MDRQLATILAALRFHQAENLQSGAGIADRAIEEIATDSGKLTALDFDEVDSLCRMINTTTNSSETF
jgi:DNA-binding Xre family transcriptional regulator